MCFQCCQYKPGMFIMQSASSSSPKSGQFSEKAPRNRIVCITHNPGSKINSCSSPTKLQSPARSLVWHSLARMMCSFAEPKGRYSQVNKDDNEVEAFRPENTTWEPFLLGRSCVQIQYSRREKSQWSYWIHQSIYHRGKVFTTEHQPREGPIYPLHCHLPAHLETTRSYTDWGPGGSWFYHQEGKTCGVLLEKKRKNQIRTMMNLSDTTRGIMYKGSLVNHWVCIQMVWKT